LHSQEMMNPNRRVH